MNITLTQETNGRLMLSISDIPRFQLKPDETLIDCVRKKIQELRVNGRDESDTAVTKNDKYADELEGFLRSLRI